MPTTFLHTADWQLGKPYARVDDTLKRGRLQNERFECLKRISALVKSHKVDFVTIAGDLFDSPSPLNASVAKALEAIGSMKVPVFVIPGNHDYGGPGSLWEQPFFVKQKEQLAPNLRVLLTPEPVVFEKAVILPGPLVRRQDLDDPTRWIREAFEETSFPADLPRIVLAHGSVQDFGASQDDEDDSSGASNHIDLSRLPEEEIDFIALGDWHGTKSVGPKAWYAGTPEIDRFPKGENNDPGNVLLVTCGRAAEPTVETIHTGGLRWNQFSHHFSGDDSYPPFLDLLKEKIGAWGQDSLLRLQLTGSLGIENSRLLHNELTALDARLLRVKLDDQVGVAPTEEEIAALESRPEDPLISAVSRQLIAMSSGDESETSRIALLELHSAIG